MNEYDSGEYEYIIQEMNWVERQSETTTEEEYYAEQYTAPVE